MFLVERDGEKYIGERIASLISSGVNNHELISIVRAVKPKDIVASSGMTLLHLSARSKNHFLTEFFIKWGVDVNAQDRHGNTPLIIAADKIDVPGARLLLDANADFKIKNFKFQSALTVGMDPWHEGFHCRDVIKLIFEKLTRDHPNIEEMVETLISAGCHLSDVLYFEYPYSMQIMKYLLDEKHYHVNSQNNRNGNTILHMAAAYNYVDLIKELLLLGADITCEDSRSHIPVVLYIYFNSNQIKEIVDMLMPKEHDWASRLPHHSDSGLKMKIVLTRGTKETLKIFRECSMNVDMTVKDEHGKTPLHYLMENDYVGILEPFENIEFDINARELKSKGAIHYAVENYDLEKTTFLLTRKAELDHFDVYDLSPLMKLMSGWPSRENIKIELAQLLLLHGADAQIHNDRGTLISIATRFETYVEVEPVLAHLVMIDVTGGDIIPLIRSHIDFDEQMKTRYALYKQQLEDMKTDYIWRSVTMFDCLTGCERKHVLYVQYREFRDRFSRGFNFNSYFVAILQKRFAKAIEIFDMRRKAVSVLSEIDFFFHLDDIIMKEIVKYLDYNDLQKFV